MSDRNSNRPKLTREVIHRLNFLVGRKIPERYEQHVEDLEKRIDSQGTNGEVSEDKIIRRIEHDQTFKELHYGLWTGRLRERREFRWRVLSLLIAALMVVLAAVATTAILWVAVNLILYERGESSIWVGFSDAATFFAGVITALAVLVGGIWAIYLYRRGRVHAAFVEIRLEVRGYAEHYGVPAAVLGVSVQNTGRLALTPMLALLTVEFFSKDFVETQVRKERIVGNAKMPRPRIGETSSSAKNASAVAGAPDATNNGTPPTKNKPRFSLVQQELFAESAEDEVKRRRPRFEPGQRQSDEVFISFGDAYPVASAEVLYVCYSNRYIPQRLNPLEGQERRRSRREFRARVILDPRMGLNTNNVHPKALYNGEQKKITPPAPAQNQSGTEANLGR